MPKSRTKRVTVVAAKVTEPATPTRDGLCDHRSMNCAAIIVNHNGGIEDFERCLAALAGQTVPVAIMLVDGASKDGTQRLTARPPTGVRGLRLDHNRGYAGGANAGWRALAPDTEFVAFFNPDCFAAPDLFERCLDRFAADGALALVAPRLARPDGRLDSCGQVPTRLLLRVRDRGYQGPPDPKFDAPAPVLAACGAGMIARVAALRTVELDDGPFPSEFFAFWEDFDLGWRLANRGWRIAYEPGARAVHRRGATAEAGQGRLIFRRPPEIAAGIVLNRWATLIHNLHPVDFLIRLPVLLPAEIVMLTAILLRRPAVAPPLLAGLPRLATAWRRRGALAQRRLGRLMR